MIIVCGTDFSDRAASAELAAAAVARAAGGAELWLVHVLDPVVRSLAPEAAAALEARADQRLLETAQRLKAQGAGAVHPVVLSGSASAMLESFAREKQADLLVVAPEGHGASPMYRLGGTSERLGHRADRAVLVVRDAEAFTRWQRREQPLRVLLAADWTRTSDAAIRWVRALRNAAPCDVVVGYVYTSGATGEGPQRYGLPARALLDPDAETERLLVRDLAARVGDLGGSGSVRFRAKLGVGRLGDHVLELADEERVDLIVVGSHQRRGLERLASVAGVVLRYGHPSVCVVPSDPHAEPAADEVPRIRRVLAATDLSARSNAAIPSAYALLGGRSGEVHLLHVLTADAAVKEADAAVALRALVPRHGVPEGVRTHVEIVRQSDAARAIREAAERIGADAICMASHGYGGLKRALLGSIAETVMRESRCPVFIVRPRPA